MTRLYQLLPLSIIWITLSSLKGHTVLPIGDTTMGWILQLLILVLFVYTAQFNYKLKKESMLFVHLYLIWIILSIVRGCFIADNYWDWRNLIDTSFCLLIPLSVHISTNLRLFQGILSFYFKFILPAFVVMAYLITIGSYGFYLVPISFLMLFFPLLRFKWKVIVVLFSILVITIDITARSNVLKFAVPVVLLLIYYFRRFIPIKFIELLRISLFVAPFVFFTLAVTEVFNVFNMDDYIQDDYITVERDKNGEINESSIKDDTRTFLYVDVLETAKKYNSWLFGRTPARGNESEMFAIFDKTGRGERQANEVGILNVFNWTGIVGVVLIFLIYFNASYLAVNKSRNTFSKMLGLFISFHWLYAWVEDYESFSLTTFFLWFMIGLCYSRTFRKMTNNDVKIWILGIFEFDYRKKIYGKIKKKELYSSAVNLP